MSKADIENFKHRLDAVDRSLTEELYNRRGVRVCRVVTPNDLFLQAGCSDFLDVQVRTPSTNSGNNTDEFEVTISTECQAMLVNGEEVEKITFTIVGGIEFAEFVNEVAAIRKVLRELNK